MPAVLSWLSRQSLRHLHALGGAMGWLAYGLSPSYRRRLKAHAAMAAVSARDRRAAVADAGRLVMELPRLWLRPRHLPIADPVHWEGAALLDEMLARGRGLVLLTPHMGSFEVSAQAYAERFGARQPITVLYRPARQRWLRELEETARLRPALNTAPANLTGVRLMMRALRRGETVGLLPDQVPPDGMGAWVPFFGQPAYTMTLAARLVQQTGAAVAILWTERLAHGAGYVVRALPLPEPLPAKAGDDAAAALAVNRSMEAVILAKPSQYLWGYNRYKQPRQPGPAGSAQPGPAGPSDDGAKNGSPDKGGSLMGGLGARALLAAMWLLHFLPLGWQAAIGNTLGRLLHRLAGSRRRVALRNVALCMPALSVAGQEALVQEHFRWVGRSLLERGMLLYGSAARLRRLIHVEGDVHLAERSPRSVMWLVPHFLGLDVAGVAVQLFQSKDGCSLYAEQSNPVLDRALRRARSRFANPVLFSRKQSVLPMVRAIKRGVPYFNPPDMDFGLRDAAFVPFFGVPAATLLAPSKLARSLDMVVQPVVAEILPGAAGWRVTFMPPWNDWPTDDAEADAARMNRFIEEQILLRPAQYLWVHKRFKTRPAGAPSVYDR